MFSIFRPKSSCIGGQARPNYRWCVVPLLHGVVVDSSCRRHGRLYSGQDDAAVNDLSQIMRPHLRSGTTFVSSKGSPLHAAYAGSTHLYDSSTSYSVRSC
ncbi:unnamed protein product [Prorocentrum cordatum]|uniref:Uncharacterized protein n=1 Tax=Prorocentrum cordatum TaxID=2364126 RepID=A0ABN9RC15_9DINO|nr:unnamed protein product [Polarella glacialis]